MYQKFTEMILSLHKENHTVKEIAKSTGYSERTVSRVIHTHREELTRRNAEWLEDHYQKTGNDLRSQAKRYTDTLAKMWLAANKCNFDDIPPDKIFRMMNIMEKSCRTLNDRLEKKAKEAQKRTKQEEEEEQNFDGYPEPESDPDDFIGYHYSEPSIQQNSIAPETPKAAQPTQEPKSETPAAPASAEETTEELEVTREVRETEVIECQKIIR